MATQRYVSTSFWDDAWIQTLDPSEKLLYLYLLTNPLTNIAGVYRVTVRRIGFDTGFNAETITHILRKFQAAGKAYMKGEYIILPTWPKHQKPDERDKIRQGIDAIISKLPEEIVMYMVSIGYQYHINGYEYQSNYSDSDSDSELESDTSVCAAPAEPSPALASSEIEKPSPKKQKTARFTPPSLEDVTSYCQERRNAVDPGRWLAYYEANGWKVGRNPMRDWRAAVRTWEGNGYDRPPGKPAVPVKQETEEQRALREKARRLFGPKALREPVGGVP